MPGELSFQNHGNSNCSINMQTIDGNFNLSIYLKLSVMGFFCHIFILLYNCYRFTKPNWRQRKQMFHNYKQNAPITRNRILARNVLCTKTGRIRAREIRHAWALFPRAFFPSWKGMDFQQSTSAETSIEKCLVLRKPDQKRQRSQLHLV